MPDAQYDRIAAAIAYLTRHADRQPELSEVARHAGLSPHHFQRTFRRWAGVSPKRFVQFLTIERAKPLLRGEASVLDATYEVGLSGPGRLHDLFVSVEAMTPGEYKALGDGLAIRWGVHASPFGRCLVGITDRGICHLAFGEREKKLAASLEAEWPAASLVRDATETGDIVRRLVAPRGEGNGRPLPLLLRGTNFQLKVWHALLRVPEGATVSYGDLARAVGRPKAVRAVGNAVGSNRIAWLIPCHRVLRSTGALGGYHWGEDRKRALLAWERARVSA